MTKLIDARCLLLARDLFPAATPGELSECAGDIQDAVDSFREYLNREPPDPDGECYRGNEWANAQSHESARIQRELKR
jgi:hypothetical protein